MCLRGLKAFMLQKAYFFCHRCVFWVRHVIEKQKRLIPIERSLSKSGKKYVISLPVALNPLWERIRERGLKIKVYIEVPENLEL